MSKRMRMVHCNDEGMLVFPVEGTKEYFESISRVGVQVDPKKRTLKLNLDPSYVEDSKWSARTVNRSTKSIARISIRMFLRDLEEDIYVWGDYYRYTYNSKNSIITIFFDE